MPSILFICTANRFRSPLAAAMMAKRLQELDIAGGWTIGSAGIWATPGLPALPEVVAAGGMLGLDLASHRSSRVSRSLVSDYDLLVVMQAGQKEALLTEYPGRQDHVYLLSELVERRSYDIPDARGSEAEMLEVMGELDSLIGRGLESMCVMATYLNNSKRSAEQ